MLTRPMILVAVAVVGLAIAAAAAASCIPMTATQQRARASVIFDGVALDGPTPSGVERFRVVRYLKGTGTRIVHVRTGRKLFSNGTGMTTSVSIDAARGDTWRIFARRVRPGLFETNVCDGSRRLRRS